MIWDDGPIEYPRAFCSLGGSGGGPAGSYGKADGGSTANVYAPTGSGTADTQAQSLMTSLYDLQPQVQNLQASYADNPYYSQALTGAQTGAQYGAGTAGAASDYSNQLYGLGYQTAKPIGSLQSGANQVLQTGFDPQNSLYQRGLQQTGDAANAINSMYGVGSSPYGAGLANDATRNYNLDWGDRQLDRQTSALKSASLGDLAASQLGVEAGTIGRSAYDQGYGATGLSASSAALPSQSYISNLGDVYTGIKDEGSYSTNLYDQLASYLGLGQSASKTSGYLGDLGEKQKESNTYGLSGLAGVGVDAIGSYLGGNYFGGGTEGTTTTGDYGSDYSSGGSSGYDTVAKLIKLAAPYAIAGIACDRRVKKDIKAYDGGLDEIRELAPVTFAYNGMFGVEDDGRTHVGLIAQDVEPVMPEAVGSVAGVKAIDIAPVLFALVNAVKEIAERLDAIERKLG